MPRVAVIGGGLGGLTTVYELVRRTRTDALPLEVRLYEADDRLGGALRTVRRDGFLLERGADSLSTENPAALQLAVELGLLDELIPARVERGVLVWWDDRFHPLPPGLSRLATGGLRPLLRSSLLSPAGKLRAGLEPLVPRRRSLSDESIAAFVRRRFGRQMLARVGDALLAGAHAGDPTLLGVRHTFPELVELERRHGSVMKGRRRESASASEGGGDFPGVPVKVTRSPRISFREGMETLVRAVEAAIRRSDTGALHVGREVRRIHVAGDPLGAAAYAVELDDGDSWVADVCVIAVPGRVAAGLVESFAPEISVELAAVPHASSLVVHLAYAPGKFEGIPDATDCLVPHSQGRPVTAWSIVHRKFDYRVPPGGALLRASLGGLRKPELIRGDDRTLERIARQEAAALFGVEAEPLLVDVARWPRARPQYLVGHAERRRVVSRHLELHSGLLVGGSALHGAGIAEIVGNARANAAVVADLLRTRLA